MKKLRVEKPEEILVPPLSEFNYICDNEIRQSKCNGVLIYRDPDFITLTSQDILQYFSLPSVIQEKTRGRKLSRWLNYLSKYNVKLENIDTRVLLESNALLTIYVDGISLCNVDGEVVIKEYRIVSTDKTFEQEFSKLMSAKPNLITVDRKDIWYLVSAYRVIYISPELRKALSKFVGIVRMNCANIRVENNTVICYLS